MMHGNGGQAANRDYVLDRMSDHDSLYVLEYPGYGSRAGSPSEQSCDAAAGEAYRVLRQSHPGTPVGVVGESLGSGPASALANEAMPPDKIVLIVPFDTLVNVASRRFFFLPVRLLMLDRWDNIPALANYRGPVDIFGASEDVVIPVKHARNLANHLPGATYTELPGGHNDWSRQAGMKIGR